MWFGFLGGIALIIEFFGGFLVVLFFLGFLVILGNFEGNFRCFERFLGRFQGFLLCFVGFLVFFGNFEDFFVDFVVFLQDFRWFLLGFVVILIVFRVIKLEILFLWFFLIAIVAIWLFFLSFHRAFQVLLPGFDVLIFKMTIIRLFPSIASKNLQFFRKIQHFLSQNELLFALNLRVLSL